MPALTWIPAVAADAEALVLLRIEAMRESLERVGRFDLERARQRFLSGFDAAHTWHIALRAAAGEGEGEGEGDGPVAPAPHRVGFFVLRPYQGELLLDHLYVRPGHQGAGLGAAALAEVFRRADGLQLPVRVGALKGSDANRFYQRHGFVEIEQAEWDTYYLRLPRPAA